ncbi:MAG: threonine ammonia-lyase [Elsteraceae bacterium]
MTVSFADVRAAAERIKGQVVRTPCLRSDTLSAITGAEVWVKFENLQFTSSFKERGALNKLTQLTAEERQVGVIAMSAGNHAQGVARHAQRLGIPATIVMPRFTPQVKIQHTRDFGARVILEGDSLSDAGAHARALTEREGYTFVHPYDDAAIVAGQGTCGLEMLEDAPEIDLLVIPVGGGGLIAGCAIGAQGMKPSVEVVGVEVDSYAACQQRLAGLPITVGGSTIAEGIAVRDIGALPLSIIQERVSEVLTVSEINIEEAIILFLTVEKSVSEGAGAAALAALLAHPKRFKGRKVGLVLCGGNIDTRLLTGVLLRGMVRDGRILRLKVDIADSPGSLAAVAKLIADGGGNVLEVQHERLFGASNAKSTDIEFTIEVRNREQGIEILNSLTDSGFKSLPLT